MAKTETTVKGYVYTVTSPNGGTVTDATGVLNKAVDAGDQVTVTAPSDSLTCSDDDAVITKANFKPAALALRLLGGGDNLPAGYTRVYFLNSSGTQYIDTEVYNFESFILDYRSSGGSYWNNILGHIPTGCTRRFAATSGQYVAVFNPNQSYVRGSTTLNPKVRNKLEYSISMGGNFVLNGEIITLTYIDQNPKYDEQKVDLSAYLFACNLGTSLSYGYAEIYGCTMLDNAGTKVRDFLPALGPDGTPCMFDLVSKQAFRNAGSGQFIVGMTLAQARKLGKLPEGTILTISLPVGYDSDEGVVTALAQAQANGCVLTIQTYKSASAVSTFALRRVWVRRQQDENGNYVDAENTRWHVEWCVDVIGADPESLGYERFRSVEVAVEYWGLTPYVDPTAELETEPETEPEL